MTFKKIKFAADSVCDIPEDLVKQHEITIIPCYVNYGGKSYADDGVELIRDKYYAELGTMKETPTTAAMPPDVAREMLHAAFEGADHLIIITTPARLSAIYNSMRLGMADLPQERVTLIDSGQLSMGIAWQILTGIEVAARTGSVEQTLEAIHRVRTHQKVYATIPTMEYLRRSGRVGWAAANVGALLQIKPVIEVVDGEAVAIARIRTFGRAVDKLAELVSAQAPLDKIALLHINNMEMVEALSEKLADVLPEEVVVGTIGPTLGTHIGPGAIGAATVRKGWR